MRILNHRASRVVPPRRSTQLAPSGKVSWDLENPSRVPRSVSLHSRLALMLLYTRHYSRHEKGRSLSMNIECYF